MNLKSLATFITNSILLYLLLTFGLLLQGASNYLALLILSSIFFGFIPYYIITYGLGKKGLFGLAPMAASSVFFFLNYLAGFAFMILFDAPSKVLAAAFALAFGEYLIAAIRDATKWRISSHALYAVICSTILVGFFQLPAFMALTIYVIFGWSRIYLKAHTPLQFLLGGILGLVVTVLAFSIVR